VSCEAAESTEDSAAWGLEGITQMPPVADIENASDAAPVRASFSWSSSSSSVTCLGRTTLLSLRILRSADVARGKSSSELVCSFSDVSGSDECVPRSSDDVGAARAYQRDVFASVANYVWGVWRRCPKSRIAGWSPWAHEAASEAQPWSLPLLAGRPWGAAAVVVRARARMPEWHCRWRTTRAPASEWAC
jgi:hypothetical protein